MAETRISKEELRRHYLQCVEQTDNLSDSQETWIGFLCGFRCYERMANEIGLAMTDEDSRRFVPISEPTSAATEPATVG